MYLNYKKINSRRREQPMLRLQTMAGKELGPIPFVSNLKFCINYADLSTITFTVPYHANSMLNPLYSMLTGYKVIYTEEFGIYVLTSPSKDGDGISETKTVTGYSLEYLLGTKNLFLEEGTYNFWNPADPADTILGRILELDQTWHAGYVAPRLIGCYRTFDQYDEDALNFCYGDAMEKYRCAFVFDVYEKTINAYDANEDAPTLPVFLNYNNLLKKTAVNEITDEMATKLHLYGSDSLTIRDVNPIGTDYIVDLSYFLHNGDLDIKVSRSQLLSDRVRQWQLEIAERQQYYIGVTSSRASLTAQRLSAEANLTDLKGELENLTAQQSVTIQAISLETTAAGKQKQQANLDRINAQITSKKDEINAQENGIDSLQKEIDRYANDIRQITGELSFSSYFTQEEQKVLNQFMIESTVEEETFVATDVDTSASGVAAKISGRVAISGSNIAKVDLSQFSKTMYTLAGGTLTIANPNITSEIVRGTLDVKKNNSYILTLYLGSTNYNGHKFESGVITVSGALTQFSSDILAQTSQGVTEYKGTRLNFQTSSADSYFTVNANDFQQYSVALELYDFGADVLSDCAWPVYEFSVDSANFLYQEQFSPFKDRLELGKAVHLEMGSDGVLNAKIIGVELNFEDISNFKLVFSNRYRLKNGVEKWIDEIRNTTRSSRRFDASKYIYNRAAEKTTAVDEFMKGTLNAAVNTILGAKNQTVLIDGAGIHVGGDSNYQLRIVDNMIAMSDDGWKTAKLAIGRFASPETGVQWGVNAELIAGNLIIGNNLIIDTGNGHFKVDKSGVYINSMKFYITNSSGKSLSDEFREISDELSGLNSDIWSLDTKLSNRIKEFYSSGYLDAGKLSGVIAAQQAKMQSAGGNVLFDSDGIWLLNGTSKGTSTRAIWMNNQGILFGSGRKTSNPGASNSGWVWTTAIGHEGITADALAGKTVSGLKLYGGELHIGPKSGGGYYFNVDSKGNMTAESGTFKGTLSAAKISGTLSAASGGGWIEGCGIRVGKNSSAAKGYNFYVDPSGNVWMQGNLTLKGGCITWDSLSSTVTNKINTAQNTANSARNEVSSLDSDVTSRLSKINTRIDGVNADLDWVQSRMITEREIRDITSTTITDELISSPSIYGAYIQGGTINGAEFMFGDYGIIYDGYGSDGVRRTDLACIESERGIRIRARDGMALEAGDGLWITGDVHLWIGGRAVNLNDFVSNMMNSNGK